MIGLIIIASKNVDTEVIFSNKVIGRFYVTGERIRFVLATLVLQYKCFHFERTLVMLRKHLLMHSAVYCEKRY